ncbi:MAG TPA: hemerythrin domain-containing protein [Pyrinomonadaceae bacterium]|nr:hemerythrin domain-containing protein [Pyrinomonadaceae bacterium]
MSRENKQANETADSERLLCLDHTDLHRLLTDAIASLERQDLEAAHRQVDYFWARLAMHIRAEHLHLFPSIINAIEGGKEIGPKRREEITETIARLRRDHNFYMNSLAEAINSLRAMVNRGSASSGEVLTKVRDVLIAIAANLEPHNEAEEKLIYKLPPTLLSGSDQAKLLVDITHELDHLPPRFRPS